VERLYGGRRIRATGRVQRFQGRPEVVLRGPGQIEVLSASTEAPAAEPPPTSPPPSAPAPRAAAPPLPAPSATPPTPAAPAPVLAAPEPPPEPPSPRGLVPAVQRRIAEATACEQARARWKQAAQAARSDAAALVRCLDDAAAFPCGPERAALGPALAVLERRQAEVEGTCP
jgi:hypothetical protein